MATYECIVIVFMISLCWGSELHKATKDAETADGSQRGRSSISQEQSCPTWYQETEYNGVTRLHSECTLVVLTLFPFLYNFASTLMSVHTLVYNTIVLSMNFQCLNVQL